ncbi:glycine dehydrogenase subunit 1 : Probable glycine dehydrogenase [decarboxylating] subunit 1 OS=Singulisphaera acidiphila (strain ATCC BAA-1392 / DSM 18658 / VKM B-2454 / MOB10) GN=gcvPA PE=3 SV=1: GDC-P [Gemmataceae bacterium]|nr:glycine dehydrogenase subunit 1 : Probable glycine dehydrogenase [decarboxylating] subunit 1 OS=Singulisphaera acidiphila (strain ATCC BAA-1392 / DSM 18658 / VKM B-2454 / MOB10) GN=gcvPA PE=3 SV=1: GDC-P [Gemmataceae bacterium]VTT98514.1 glycine dehydrogenase subunit 1 : Probable glycine dehydrogenase [decarboxylating] subunit 1 OS=Singulisphaera acidiphila (strain ATCC BAA-1392 / DSM 18658 / VKM B-2454 / MOB10) GN=gcvPA PE=3 SV=1: GDC-P [Gemmataceae bacterium]
MSYVPNTADDRAAMLAKVGVASVDDLFANIPPALRLNRPLDIPPALGEMDLQRHISHLAHKNQAASNAICFLGGGAYDHFIPSVVDAVAGRSEFYTAYTPYQAEASQGTLQAVFEFQTLMCQLTGLEVANASLYEGGSAVAEAVLMALGVTGRTGEVLVAESVHPEYRQVLATFAANLNCTVRTLPTPDGVLNPGDVRAAVTDATVAVIAQSPNFFGHLEDMQAIGDAARRVGAVFIASFDPVLAGVLKRPGDYGADIAVAEGQGLGVPLGFGGPYLGILACRGDSDYVRKIPGRLVGQTTDRNGKRCWVLTLQTREQHIRREKATSNICTNQGLLALRAAVHLTALGPEGLRETAELCVRKAHYAAEQLAKVPGVSLRFAAPFGKEFTIKVPGNAPALLENLRLAGFHAGLALGRWYPGLKDCISVAVTEQRTKAEIDGLAAAVRASV